MIALTSSCQLLALITGYAYWLVMLAHAQPAKLIPGLELPFQTFIFPATYCGTLQLGSGTEICIPANALLTPEGQPITGDYTLKYRELRHPAEIFVTGVRMLADLGGGRRQYLETDGMFELRAEQNGKVLHVAPKKVFKVRFAGETTQQANKQYRYDFYKMNPQTGLWQPLQGLDVKVDFEVSAPGLTLSDESQWQTDNREGFIDEPDGLDAPFRATVFRELEIEDFGLYNCDRIIEEQQLQLTVNLNPLDPDVKKALASVSGQHDLVVVYTDIRSVFTYNVKQLKAQVTIYKDKPLKMFMVLPDKTLLHVPLAQLDTTVLAQAGNQPVYLDLIVHFDELASLDELKTYLASTF